MDSILSDTRSYLTKVSRGELQIADEYSWRVFSPIEYLTNSSTDSLLTENLIDFDIEFIPVFLSILKSEISEYGKKNESTIYFEKIFQKDSFFAELWLSSLIEEYYDKDIKILLGLLNVVEQLDQKILVQVAATMQRHLATPHENIEVNELIVRILEKWNSKKSYDILKQLVFETMWLQEYVGRLLEEFKP